MNLLDAIQQAVVASSINKQVVIGPPSAVGPSLTVIGIAPGTIANFNDGTRIVLLQTTAGNTFFGPVTADALNFQTGVGGLVRLSISAVGNVTINAPTNGAALSISGLANNNTVTITAPNTASQSFGLQIIAGTNSSDFALSVKNAANTQSFLLVSGNGRVTVNAATTDVSMLVNGATSNDTLVVTGAVTSGQSQGIRVQAGTTSADYAFKITNQSNSLNFLFVRGDGSCTFNSVSTTASAANAFLDNANSNNLLRSTSSLRYKQDILDLDSDAIDKIIMDLRPISYRSKSEADDSSLRWYGLIAEEVATVEPRLVTWTKLQTGIKELFDEEKVKVGEEQLFDGGLVPDGVQYERICVLLLSKIQRMQSALTKAGILNDTGNQPPSGGQVAGGIVGGGSVDPLPGIGGAPT